MTMNLKFCLNKSIWLLRESRIPNPELDARVLLKTAIKKDDAFIYSHPEYILTTSESKKLKELLGRRKTGEPVAYITGHKEFYGYDFLVNANVLVPRPESEWLVEKGVEHISKLSVIGPTTGEAGCQLSVLDMGTGSGCIAIALSKVLSKTDRQSSRVIYAADSSSRAVGTAKKNCLKLKAENIVFLNSDLFENRRIKNKIFDLIIANLPYVPRKKQEVNKRSSEAKDGIDFEPQDAIFANNNGTAIIKIFLKAAKFHTTSGSLLLLELDPRNAMDLLKFARDYYPNAKINLEKDHSGLDRYLIVAL